MVTEPIIVIVGQTATGKSAAAIDVALQYGGEIICADSRTVYKGMDIGTAKPSAHDLAKVLHHGIDLVTPDKTFSAFDFQQYAKAKIVEIRDRGNIPIIVGGTGLYVDGFIYDYSFGPAANLVLREELDNKSLQELQQAAKNIGIYESEINFKNRRHLSRAIERGKISLQKKQLPNNLYMYGMKLDSDEVKLRIRDRIEHMKTSGLVDEVRTLVSEYGLDAPGMRAPIYKAFSEYILDNTTIEQATEKANQYDYQLAKRQLTWFKRNPDIHWVQSVTELKKEITPYLTKI